MEAETIDVAVLAERVENVEEREASTRRRLDGHLNEEREDRAALVEAITAIRLDVHALRTSKKILVAMVALIGGGVIGVTSWTVQHAFRDFLIESHVIELRRIP